MASTTTACPACGTVNRLRPDPRGRPRCTSCRAPLPWIVAADDARSFDAETDSALPVVVDLWAPWCGPCRAVTPVLEGLARERAGDVKLVTVNIDVNPEIARRFQVQSIPTMLVIRRGELLDRIVGAPGADQLRRRIESHLAAGARG